MKNANFGFGQIMTPPPKWVIVVVIVIVIALYTWQQIIQGDPIMKEVVKLRLINYLSNIQMGLLAVAALFGVKPSKKNVE